ncbi:FGGY-family carbohydrate kinase [Nodosilinea sp. LEGE 07088]|uniref:FGGY-family carbohydrate kinase n=1 Tax=Nodosilinea sp. LEGE 07088 TaxID=2777968 RepID=UPI0018818857|nr:FGGY-family carbohydrate kinase [Nodosilinea sp. LEGE 07088]MBE9139337.1 FGGY-family carbohydrate kinase [Nodosilinea sp. LEGE 07088]
MTVTSLALGLDFGTSGVRAAVVNPQRHLCWQHRASYPDLPAPDCWQQALFSLLEALPQDIRPQVGRIAIDGTSATVVLCDALGEAIAPPLFYNHPCPDSLTTVKALAPIHSPAASATSSLAKLVWWHQALPAETWRRARYLLHQADWVSAQLHGQWGVSDYHNSLKLGYDVGRLGYPSWMLGQPWSPVLPRVVAPGAPVGPVMASVAQRFGLAPQCQVVAGTTDSIAAFLASGATDPGDGVTSLGSTLVIKLLSDQRIEAGEYGIYSHRLGFQWLVGGASNSGGAVLEKFFTREALIALSQQINPVEATPLDYYPLVSPGERFPINDPGLAPRLTPRPDDDVAFLHGLLMGIARIEQRGYELLAQLGASPLRQIYTAGGGAANETWRQLRASLMSVPIKNAASVEAAVGSAYLALP